MAVAMYVKFSNIKGECREAAHKEWMQVEQVQFGVRQNASARRSTGGNQAAGEADFPPVTIRMLLDSAYPKLAEGCWRGTHYDEVTIDFCRSGNDKHIFHQYKFKNVLITSVGLSAESQGEDNLPTVEFSFTYDHINNEYFLTENLGGGVSGSVGTGFNLATREPV